MLESFLIKKHHSQFDMELDYERIIALPDDKFAQLYLELINEYRQEHGWWEECGRIPRCDRCEIKIPSPSEMRYYHGLLMHPDCFKLFYELQGVNEGKTINEYWKRVSNLVIA